MQSNYPYVCSYFTCNNYEVSLMLNISVYMQSIILGAHKSGLPRKWQLIILEPHSFRFPFESIILFEAHAEFEILLHII